MNLPLWELGQYVRVWRSGSAGEHDAGGYEYGHIESMDNDLHEAVSPVIECVVEGREPGRKRWDRLIDVFNGRGQVMLVGDDGKEIYCQVKDLETE